MTAQANAPHRSFLDATKAETSADLGALRSKLSDAARDADKLGLPEVKEHVEAALAHAEEQADGANEA